MPYLSRLTAALLAASLAGVLAMPAARAITGGTPVGKAHPMSRTVVLVKITTPDREAACTGFIWSETLIVTAAHCLTDRPDDFASLPPDRRKEALTAARPLRTAAVRIYYRHAARWVRPDRFVLEQESDRGLIVMRRPHPDGYIVPRIDHRGARDVIREARDARFLSVGHVGLEQGGIGSLHVLETDARTLLLQASTGNIVLERLGNVGTCHGDSGAPVYVKQNGAGLRLIGMHQGGSTANKDFVVPGTNNQCSRVSFIIGLDRLIPWIDRALGKVGATNRR